MKSYTEYTKYTEYVQKKKEKKIASLCHSVFRILTQHIVMDKLQNNV